MFSSDAHESCALPAEKGIARDRFETQFADGRPAPCAAQGANTTLRAVEALRSGLSQHHVHEGTTYARKTVAGCRKLVAAQQANEWDMNGHAQKAKELLDQVNRELKEAAEAANANAHR